MIFVAALTGVSSLDSRPRCFVSAVFFDLARHRAGPKHWLAIDEAMPARPDPRGWRALYPLPQDVLEPHLL